jgi:D-aminopeptidase
MRVGSGIVLIADIEGSSGCPDRLSAQWLNPRWVQACFDMTRDVLSVVAALQADGESSLSVVDFHRTGFNLFRDLFPANVRLRQGYRVGPIPGIGEPPAANRALFLGMHAAAGTHGFLAHTLTSRFRSLTLNGRPLAEIELFAASLGHFGIRPVFFSGCATACSQAAERIPGLPVFAVPPKPLSEAQKTTWREHMSAAAVIACRSPIQPAPYAPSGPFHLELREVGPGGSDGASVREQAWTTSDFPSLYRALLRRAYYARIPEGFLPLGLRLNSLLGRCGLAVARRHWRNLILVDEVAAQGFEGPGSG